MVLEIFISSIILGLIILSLLALKWKISLKVAIISALGIGVITGFIVNWIFSANFRFNLLATIIVEVIFILILASIGAMYRFYRDPERKPSEAGNVILAPADGKIIYISPIEKDSSLISIKKNKTIQLKELTETNLLPDAAYMIGIEMNLLNVHVNRSPMAGKIVMQKHISGKFLSLGRPEAEVLNERVTTILDNGVFRIGVVQIASRLVRQIVSYLKEGDLVSPGQRIGMIRFGSQVDVIITQPKNLKLNIKVGDIVKAGYSVIAKYG